MGFHQFTWNYSYEEFNFLDVKVFVENGILKTNITLKSSSTLQYLQSDSCHPLYIKKSIPKALIVRAKKLRTNESDFQNCKNKLNNAFQNRGYSMKMFDNHIENNPDFFSNYKKCIISICLWTN